MVSMRRATLLPRASNTGSEASRWRRASLGSEPCIAGVFRSEHQRNADAVLVGAAKAVAPAVEADACPFRRLDEAARIHGAEVQAGMDRLPLSHEGVDAVPGPERPADRSSNPIALHGAVTASDVSPFPAFDRDDGIRFRFRPVLHDRLEKRFETAHGLASGRLRRRG